VTSFGDGCPDDRSILTYSESENPNSPYFADQTRMFSDKQWVDPPFCADEVSGDPDLSTEVITDGAAEPPAAGQGGNLGSGGSGTAKRRKCKRKKHHARSSRRCHHKKRR
jgi:hypothetical protein